MCTWKLPRRAVTFSLQLTKVAGSQRESRADSAVPNLEFGNSMFSSLCEEIDFVLKRYRKVMIGHRSRAPQLQHVKKVLPGNVLFTINILTFQKRISPTTDVTCHFFLRQKSHKKYGCNWCVTKRKSSVLTVTICPQNQWRNCCCWRQKGNHGDKITTAILKQTKVFPRLCLCRWIFKNLGPQSRGATHDVTLSQSTAPQCWDINPPPPHQKQNKKKHEHPCRWLGTRGVICNATPIFQGKWQWTVANAKLRYWCTTKLCSSFSEVTLCSTWQRRVSKTANAEQNLRLHV